LWIPPIDASASLPFWFAVILMVALTLSVLSGRDMKFLIFKVKGISPTNNNDPGEVARTNYLVADRLATLCDEDGKPIGKEHSIGPGETERQIAGRLVREARAAVGLDFNRPLRYQPLGIA
jgi:hypothetical protein